MTRMPDAEPAPDDQQQVRVLNGEIARPVPQVTRTPAVQRVVGREQIDRLPARRNRHTKPASDALKYFKCTRTANALAGKDHRTTGGRDALQDVGTDLRELRRGVEKRSSAGS